VGSDPTKTKVARGFLWIHGAKSGRLKNVEGLLRAPASNLYHCIMRSLSFGCLLRSRLLLQISERGHRHRHASATTLRLISLPPRGIHNGLKSKVGLDAAKTATLRINLNIDGCGVVAPPVHSSLRAPLLLANLLAHNLPLPRAAH